MGKIINIKGNRSACSGCKYSNFIKVTEEASGEIYLENRCTNKAKLRPHEMTNEQLAYHIKYGCAFYTPKRKE